ncbi:uncharacterized protein AB675_4582 [Cyphellophora attinorum]|uniref:Heterokaryon incompatibility domain-containing protein n=1 Tax=Cyphellophora attinorum TaxID=1664694 RepID=A0A0N1H319_9EURO|nr:uncharacterized protein AB675_4582 [Phialophora attinorum]KPI39097.1 hypothetical protein AB675_4582 [Phialophora attinorum]
MLFQYTHLAPATIRLASFTPSATSTSISLHLEHQPNYSSPTSRSYTVLLTRPDQSSAERKSITLHGRTRLVPSNVHDALSVILRHHRETLGQARLYMESICVNARDEAEVASQNAQRELIWRCAEAVIVWSGDGEDGSSNGHGLFPRLAKAMETKGVQPVRDAIERGGGTEDEAGMRQLADVVRAATAGATLSKIQNLEALLGEHRIAIKDCDGRMTSEEPTITALQSDEHANKKATL